MWRVPPPPPLPGAAGTGAPNSEVEGAVGAGVAAPPKKLVVVPPAPTLVGDPNNPVDGAAAVEPKPPALPNGVAVGVAEAAPKNPAVDGAGAGAPNKGTAAGMGPAFVPNVDVPNDPPAAGAGAPNSPVDGVDPNAEGAGDPNVEVPPPNVLVAVLPNGAVGADPKPEVAGGGLPNAPVAGAVWVTPKGLLCWGGWPKPPPPPPPNGVFDWPNMIKGTLSKLIKINNQEKQRRECEWRDKRGRERTAIAIAVKRQRATLSSKHSPYPNPRNSPRTRLSLSLSLPQKEHESIMASSPRLDAVAVWLAAALLSFVGETHEGAIMRHGSGRCPSVCLSVSLRETVERGDQFR